jgi:DNA-binding response OmpR family regulator
MTLIYLDDDQDDLELFKMAAKPVEGIKQIYTTTSYISFFELLKSNIQKTIVFIDINMPVKNGFSILKEIREEKQFDPVVVVMYSTTLDKVSVAISRELGANYYSGKPDNLRRLQEIITTVLSGPIHPADPVDFLISV